MTFISAFQAINDNSFTPFAIDIFGKFYCFSLKNHTIVYYGHEEKIVTKQSILLNNLLKVCIRNLLIRRT